MLQDGNIVEGTWRIGRLLMDDGLAAYHAASPTGPDAPDPAPVCLLRAVERTWIGEGLPGWPLPHPRPENAGVPERIFTGEDGRPVLVDVFDASPAEPLFQPGRRLAPDAALDLLVEACRLVGAYHEEHWVLRTLNARSFFRTADVSGLQIFPPPCPVRSGKPLSFMLGTPGYVAPEAWGPAKAEPSMDIYALGAAAWAWLSGRHPFAEIDDMESLRDRARAGSFPDLSKEFDDVPPEAASLVSASTSAHPQDRPRKAADLARRARDALQAVRRTGASAARESSRPGAEAPSASRKRVTRIVPFSLSDIIDETEQQRE